LRKKITAGIDLAAKPKNPTGWALLKDNFVETSIIHADDEILKNITSMKPTLTAIDAPLSFPKIGTMREADREMIRKGYRVFPLQLPTMTELTVRATRLNTLILEKGYKTIETHPKSARKALKMPTKPDNKVQEILRRTGLRGDLEKHALTPHEIDAIVAALVAHLHIRGETESVGNNEEDRIIVPRPQDWRTLKA
jgi:predicted nuclease with RNAse H fold